MQLNNFNELAELAKTESNFYHLVNLESRLVTRFILRDSLRHQSGHELSQELFDLISPTWKTKTTAWGTVTFTGKRTLLGIVKKIDADRFNQLKQEIAEAKKAEKVLVEQRKRERVAENARKFLRENGDEYRHKTLDELIGNK